MKMQLEKGNFHEDFKNVGPNEIEEDSEAISVDEKSKKLESETENDQEL